MPGLHISLNICIWFCERGENSILSREILGAALLFTTDKWSGSLELVLGGENPTPIGSLAQYPITNQEGANVHSMIPAGARTPSIVAEYQIGSSFCLHSVGDKPHRPCCLLRLVWGFFVLCYCLQPVYIRRSGQMSYLPFLPERWKL